MLEFVSGMLLVLAGNFGVLEDVPNPYDVVCDRLGGEWVQVEHQTQPVGLQWKCEL